MKAILFIILLLVATSVVAQVPPPPPTPTFPFGPTAPDEAVVEEEPVEEEPEPQQIPSSLPLKPPVEESPKVITTISEEEDLPEVQEVDTSRPVQKTNVSGIIATIIGIIAIIAIAAVLRRNIRLKDTLNEALKHIHHLKKQEAHTFIKHYISLGYTREQIENMLIGAGWTRHHIEELMREYGS